MDVNSLRLSGSVKRPATISAKLTGIIRTSSRRIVTPDPPKVVQYKSEYMVVLQSVIYFESHSVIMNLRVPNDYTMGDLKVSQSFLLL